MTQEAGVVVRCPVVCIVLLYRMHITYLYSLIGKPPLLISGSNKPSDFRIVRWACDVIPASELKRNDDSSDKSEMW